MPNFCQQLFQKKFLTLQFMLSVIQFDLSSKQVNFHSSKVWTKRLVYTSRLFPNVRIFLQWRFDYVIRGWLTETVRVKTFQTLVNNYYVLEERNNLCAPFFRSPSTSIWRTIYFQCHRLQVNFPFESFGLIFMSQVTWSRVLHSIV